MWRRRLRHAYLTGPRVVGRVLKPTPFAHDHEQRPAIIAAEHAREAPAITIDALKHLAAFANAHASLVGHVGVPDGAFGIDTDTVRHSVPELGPGPAVRQRAIAGNVKRGELFPYESATMSVELSGVTAIPFGNAMPSATRRTGAIPRHKDDHSSGELLARHHIKPATVHVRVAATVDDDFVPAARGAARVGVCHERSIRILAKNQGVT